MRSRLLLVVLASLVIAGPARADEEGEGEIIVIVGLRLPRPLPDVPAAVTVIERDELERSPLVLTDELLRTVPSVGTFRRSASATADPTSQGLNLRGVGPSAVSRALVLRDGVPANDPFGGWMYWRAISPLAVERIEVAPGGASALFGNFALGGVVDVVSRPLARRRLEALVAGGTLDTARVAVRASDRRGALAGAVDVEGFRTGGHTPVAADQRGPIDGRAATRHATVGARLEHAGDGSTTHVTARWFDEALDAGTRDTTADVRAVTYGAGWRGRGFAIDAFGGDQRFDQTRARIAPDRADATVASRQRTPSSDQGAAVTWTTRAGARHELVVGADARRVEGTATDVLSPPMIDASTVVVRAAGGEQRYGGVFAQDAVRLTAAVELVAALRLDAWQDVGGARTIERGDGTRDTTMFGDRDALQVDPRLGVLAHLSEALAVRASAYRAFRAPTLNELYRPFQVGTILTAANEQLRPEVLWGAEAGAQVGLDRVSARATAFYNHVDDPIANVTLAMPRPDGAARQRQNLGAARVAGLELDLSWRPTAAWQLTVAHVFLAAEVVEAPANPDLVGRGLPHDPRHRATATLTYDDPRHATITGEARYLGRSFEDDLQTLPLGSVVLLDARVARAVGGGFTVFAAGQNLLDRRYLVGRAGVDTVGAPRTVEVGLAYSTR